MIKYSGITSECSKIQRQTLLVISIEGIESPFVVSDEVDGIVKLEL